MSSTDPVAVAARLHAMPDGEPLAEVADAATEYNRAAARLTRAGGR